MSKGLKKGLIIAGSILLLLLIFMVSIPLLFKDKIKDTVVNTANEMLNAKLDVKGFDMSLFSNFPNATLSMENTSVVGVGDFANDTLLQAKSASITIDIKSLFSDNYDIKKINLTKASIYAKVLSDGRANWDIMKVDSTGTTTNAETESPFNLSLRKISINDCNVVFQNDSTNMKAMIQGLNGDVAGDFSANETTLKINALINELTFMMDNVPYLNKVKATTHAKLHADLDKMKFKFEESKLQINELKASVDGTFGFVGEEGMEFDLKLNAPDIQFKDVLSLIPAIYAKDFKDIKTEGTAKLDASVKGLMEGETYPAFDLKMVVDKAMFQYPSLPKSVNNIHADIAVSNIGGSLDNTVVNISKFNFTMGGNPFSGSVHVTTPMSDANIKAHAKGIIDLAMIREVYPLEQGTQLNGKLDADIDLATKMSSIEKEQYENVSATGHLKVTGMTYKAKDMPDVLINTAAMDFTPRYANLTSLDVKIGKNDISATGRLENFIAYALKDQTLKGTLNLKSNYFNANDFISEETAGAGAESSTSEDIVIPKNIDFTANAAFNQILYGKMDITSATGSINVKDGILHMNNISAKALGGTGKITGAYNTSNPKTPKVNFNVNLNKVSFAETFKQVEAAAKFAPIIEKLQGNYSMSLNFDTSLGSTLTQSLTALTGNGSVQTSDLKLDGIPALTALSAALKTDALKSFSAKDLNIPFSIKDGKVIAKPFNLNMGNGGVLKLEGTTGLDQSIDYKGTVTLPKNLSNQFINNVPLTIGGTFTNPKVGIDMKAAAEEAIKNTIGNAIGDKLGNTGLGSVISGDKAAQAQKLREEAKRASNQLVEEAQRQADNLEKEAKNPIVKATAKIAGKKLVDEAKKQGQKLIDKADEKAKALEAGQTVPAE